MINKTSTQPARDDNLMNIMLDYNCSIISNV
jgi:hypothetical protein